MATATLPKTSIEKLPSYLGYEARYQSIRAEIAGVEADLFGVSEKVRAAREAARQDQAQAIADGKQPVGEFHIGREFDADLKTLRARHDTLHRALGKAMQGMRESRRLESARALADARPEIKRLVKAQLDAADALVASRLAWEEFRAGLEGKGVDMNATGVTWISLAPPNNTVESLREGFAHWATTYGLI